MWKLKNKKGNTLIEVVCSIVIFYSCFIFIITMEINNIKLNKENVTINENICYVEALKNIFNVNYTYEELENLKGSKHYISKDNLYMDILLNNEIFNIMVNSKPDKEPYVLVDIYEDEILCIDILLKYKKDGRMNEIKTHVYKSRYCQ